METWKVVELYRTDDKYPDGYSRYISELEVDHGFVRFGTRLVDYYQDFSV